MLCLWADYVLASRLFACSGLLWEHLFSRIFGAIFFCSKLVRHFLYLAVHGVFSALILHSAASDRDYFKASYNGLLIYLARMRKLALHWPLASWWQLLLWIWLPLPHLKSLAQQIFEPAQVNHETEIFIWERRASYWGWWFLFFFF